MARPAHFSLTLFSTNHNSLYTLSQRAMSSEQDCVESGSPLLSCSTYQEFALDVEALGTAVLGLFGNDRLARNFHDELQTFCKSISHLADDVPPMPGTSCWRLIGPASRQRVMDLLVQATGKLWDVIHDHRRGGLADIRNMVSLLPLPRVLGIAADTDAVLPQSLYSTTLRNVLARHGFLWQEGTCTWHLNTSGPILPHSFGHGFPVARAGPSTAPVLRLHL